MGRTNDNPGDIKQFESIFSGAQKRYGLLIITIETGEKDCIEKTPNPSRETFNSKRISWKVTFK